MLKLLRKGDFKDTTITFFTSLIVGLLGISTTVLLARSLGSDGFGSFSFLTVKGVLIGTILLPGLSVVFSREIVKGELEGVSAVGLILSCASVLFAGIGIIVYSQTTGELSSSILPVVFLPVIVGEFSYGVLQAQGEFRKFNFLRLANSLIVFLLALLSLNIQKLTYESLFLSISIARGVLLIAGFSYAFDLFREANFYKVKHILAQGVTFTLMGFGRSTFDYYVHSLIGVGTKELGYFNSGSSILIKLKDHVKGVLNVLILKRVRSSDKDYSKLGCIYLWFFIVFVFIATLNAFLSKWYVKLLLGSDFSQAHMVFSIYGFIISIGLYSSYFLNRIVYFHSMSRLMKVSSFGLLLDFLIVSCSAIGGGTSAVDISYSILLSRILFLFFVAFLSRDLKLFEL